MGKPDFKSPRQRSVFTKPRAAISRPKPTSNTLKSANIKVVVRVRPPNLKEQNANSRKIVKFVDEKVLVFDPKINSQAFFYHGVEQKGRDLLRKANKDLQFQFDSVFDFESTNQLIFENTTKDLIESLMNGFNCSVFAYGATGAGKTHTMIGSNDNPGITYLTMAELFKTQNELSNERTFELGISYLEVYNETVQDLLNPGKPLQLRDDGNYGVMVAGIKVHKIGNPDDLFTLLAQGNGNRTQHPTDANAESSRSHAVFQVYIQMEFKASREIRTAKLSMIDLAGSERGSATGFGGARFTEGANINKSLLALGNCINSLADGQKYVPFRNSKLTRLLKDSLGGNCQTIMIANVSPSSLSFEDTYNTLKYATRAKNIKSDVSRNVVNVELHAGEYVKIVADLKRELEKCKAQLREKGEVVSVKVDPEIAAELTKLFEQRKKLVERQYNVECSERMVIIRRKLKEDADSRLSGLMNDTPKHEAHRRLEQTVCRFNRQEEALKLELDQIKESKTELDEKIVALGNDHPELNSHIELDNLRLDKIEGQYQLDVVKKKESLLDEERKSMGALLEKTCKVLKSCYFQLRGHGFISETLSNDYHCLVNHLQGRKNITWDDALDSGMSSSSSLVEDETTIATTKTQEQRTTIKRKLSMDENGDLILDSTFISEPKPKITKASAEELIAKAKSTTPLRKRNEIASNLNALKENKRIPNSSTIRSHYLAQKRPNSVKQHDPIKKPPFRT